MLGFVPQPNLRKLLQVYRHHHALSVAVVLITRHLHNLPTHASFALAYSIALGVTSKVANETKTFSTDSLGYILEHLIFCAIKVYFIYHDNF
jgi:hypothetical protein